MKSVLVNDGENRELLIFFHGWSMDFSSVSHLDPAGRAVLVCWDYTTPDDAGVLRQALDRYPVRRLAAWSLGVWAGAAALEGAALADAVAWNGSLAPVDAQYGIDPEIFDGTIANWLDGAARAAFYRRVYNRPASAVPERAPEAQQAELASLRRRIAEVGTPPNCYRRAVIGVRDRIFGADHLRAAWALAGVPCAEIASPHDILSGRTKWEELFHVES